MKSLTLLIRSCHQRLRGENCRIGFARLDARVCLCVHGTRKQSLSSSSEICHFNESAGQQCGSASGQPSKCDVAKISPHLYTNEDRAPSRETLKSSEKFRSSRLRRAGIVPSKTGGRSDENTVSV
jgi:hypothetical protein